MAASRWYVFVVACVLDPLREIALGNADAMTTLRRHMPAPSAGFALLSAHRTNTSVGRR